jgi:hypothetical protein
MSLTTELRNPRSAISRYLATRFDRLDRVFHTWTEATRGARPVLPPAPVDWALVGQAFGHRLGFAFCLDPPYAPILGACQYVATEQLRHLAAAEFAAMRPLPAELAGYVRVLTRDQYVPLLAVDPELDAEEGLWAEPDDSMAHLLGFFRVTAQLVERLGGRRPDPDDPAERPLLAACYVLGVLERAYRGSRPVPGLAEATPERLLASVPAAAIDDLAELTRVLAGEGGSHLARLRSPALVAPVSIEHWAEGDLALGGTLLDCKVTKYADFTLDVFHQVLAYLLLDHGDWYQLDAAGIYLARQGRLVRWPLEQLMDATGDPRVTLADLRAEFAELLGSRMPQHLVDSWTTFPPAAPVIGEAFLLGHRRSSVPSTRTH